MASSICVISFSQQISSALNEVSCGISKTAIFLADLPSFKMEDCLYASAPGSDSWKYAQDIKVSKLFMNSGYDCIVEIPLPPRVMPTIDVNVNHGI